MKRSMKILVAALAVAAIAGAAPASAQDSGVGELRVVDDSGQTLGQEPAPPVEKLYRLEAGVDRFTVAWKRELELHFRTDRERSVHYDAHPPGAQVFCRSQIRDGDPGIHPKMFAKIRCS